MSVIDNQFLRVAISLALISIGIIGVMLAGSAVFSDANTENAKKQLGSVVFGLVLIIIGGLVVSIVVR